MAIHWTEGRSPESSRRWAREQKSMGSEKSRLGVRRLVERRLGVRCLRFRQGSIRCWPVSQRSLQQVGRQSPPQQEFASLSDRYHLVVFPLRLLGLVLLRLHHLHLLPDA